MKKGLHDDVVLGRLAMWFYYIIIAFNAAASSVCEWVYSDVIAWKETEADANRYLRAVAKPRLIDQRLQDQSEFGWSARFRTLSKVRYSPLLRED